MASADEIVEDKANEHKEGVVKGDRKRYVGRAVEGDGEMDVLEETFFELLVEYPLEQWCQDAGKEEEDETIVDLTVRQ